jgi:hypothetical protein
LTFNSHPATEVSIPSRRDEPTAGENQILNERVGVGGAAEPRLVIHGQNQDFAASDHPTELLEPITVGLGAGLGLVVDDNGLDAGQVDAVPGRPGADLTLLVGATLGPLHVARIATLDHDFLGNHQATSLSGGAVTDRTGLAQ